MKPRKARSQSPTTRRKRRTSPRERRVSPRCKPNKKYSCNYDNITTGKCPGYLVDRRRRQSRDEAGQGQPRKVVYEMKWRLGVAQDKPIRSPATRSTSPATTPRGPRGYDFTSRRAINRGAAGLENDTQCLPRNENGDIKPAARGKQPNEYCQRYRGPAVRQQRGCVAAKGARRQRRIVAPALLAAPSPLASPRHGDEDNPFNEAWAEGLPDFLRGGRRKSRE
jgi:hypothetical protein